MYNSQKLWKNETNMDLEKLFNEFEFEGDFKKESLKF